MWLLTVHSCRPFVNCFQGIVYKPEEDVFLKPKRIVEKRRIRRPGAAQTSAEVNDSDAEDEELGDSNSEGDFSKLYAATVYFNDCRQCSHISFSSAFQGTNKFCFFHISIFKAFRILQQKSLTCHRWTHHKKFLSRSNLQQRGEGPRKL